MHFQISILQRRLRVSIEDKLRSQDLYIEEDDDNFMVEPDKPKPVQTEDDKADPKNKRKRAQSNYKLSLY